MKDSLPIVVISQSFKSLNPQSQDGYLVDSPCPWQLNRPRVDGLENIGIASILSEFTPAWLRSSYWFGHEIHNNASYKETGFGIRP